MWYTYVIWSLRTNLFYIGFTADLKKRIFQHQHNQSEYTKNRGPWKLIYYEAGLSKEDAIAREKYLKSGMGHRYIKNRLKNFILFKL